MIADFMFSLNFLPGHLQLSWWCWLCALSTWQHHVKIALRRRRFDWLWLHRLWFTWCFHWISSRTSTASWWCCLWLCGLSTRQHRVKISLRRRRFDWLWLHRLWFTWCFHWISSRTSTASWWCWLWLCGLSTRQRRVKISLRRRRFDWLWLHRLWFTLIHWIFFQDIYGKLVMLALALCALHTIASWENRTEAEALCTDFDSLATNCFAVFSRTVDTHTHTHISYTFWLAMSCELLAQNKMLQTCPIINASKWTKGFPQNQNQTQWFGHHWTIKMMFKHHQTFEHHQNHSGLQKHQHHAVVYHYKSSWCSISATSQANQKVQSKWDLSISQVDQRSSEYPLVNSVNERDLNLLNTYM